MQQGESAPPRLGTVIADLDARLRFEMLARLRAAALAAKRSSECLTPLAPPLALVRIPLRRVTPVRPTPSQVVNDEVLESI